MIALASLLLHDKSTFLPFSLFFLTFLRAREDRQNGTRKPKGAVVSTISSVIFALEFSGPRFANLSRHGGMLRAAQL